MKFILASSSRYPTEKAYGVNFQNTAKSLRDLGYSVEIYSPSFQGLDASNIQVTQIAKKSFQLLHSQNILLKRLSHFRTYFVELVFAISVFWKVRKIIGPYTLWTRSTLLSVIASKLIMKSDIRVVLEVHNSESRMNFFLKFIRFDQRIFVFTPLPLQAKHLEDNHGLQRVEIIGNATPVEYFGHDKHVSGKFQIGYIGKLESSGHSNNVLALINLANLIHKNKYGIGVTLVGIPPKEIQNLASRHDIRTIPPNLTLVGHIPHSEIIEYLLKFDVGIVPYPESNYHNQRFPIKIIEYAAAGVPIVICNSKYLNSVIPAEFVYLSGPTPNDLLDVILEIFNSPSQAAYKSQLARKWAAGFTYQKRTEKILRGIGAIPPENP